MGGETTTSRSGANAVTDIGAKPSYQAIRKRSDAAQRAAAFAGADYADGQIAVCNCHHNVEQQLCRLLLFSMNRLPGSNGAHRN
jgi:hypothetical protein